MQSPPLLPLPHAAIEPQAVSALPTAPGFLLLMLLLLASIFYIWRRYRTLAWRRQALKELQTLYQDYLGKPDSLSYCKGANALLKRVALQRFSKAAGSTTVTSKTINTKTINIKTVAPLFGESWLAFLDETCKGSAFVNDFSAFASLPYQSSVKASDPSLKEFSILKLNKHIKRWIIKHNPEKNPTRTLSSERTGPQDTCFRGVCKEDSPRSKGFSAKAIPS